MDDGLNDPRYNFDASPTLGELIAQQGKGPITDIRILHGLNNIDYGAWEGLTASEAQMYDPRAFEAYRTSPSTAVCPAGERLRDGQQRVLDAIALMAARHRGETVVAVTHAVMIRLAVAAIQQVEGEQWRLPLGRGSLSKFEIGEDITISLPEGGDVD